MTKKIWTFSLEYILVACNILETTLLKIINWIFFLLNPLGKRVRKLPAGNAFVFRWEAKNKVILKLFFGASVQNGHWKSQRHENYQWLKTLFRCHKIKDDVSSLLNNIANTILQFIFITSICRFLMKKYSRTILSYINIYSNSPIQQLHAN